MTPEPLYARPKDIPASAAAREQQLRQIRESVTASERMAAWQSLWSMPMPRRMEPEQQGIGRMR